VARARGRQQRAHLLAAPDTSSQEGQHQVATEERGLRRIGVTAECRKR